MSIQNGRMDDTDIGNLINRVDQSEIEINRLRMSLRDHFAGLALNGIMASCPGMPMIDLKLSDIWSQQAYLMADAMLRAREAKP